MIFEFPLEQPAAQDYSSYFKSDGFKDERHVSASLRSLGHRVFPYGIKNDLNHMIQYMSEHKIDLVFNLCEAFDNDRAKSVDLVSTFSLLGIPHTGADAKSLSICSDKKLTKMILESHGIHTPASYDEQALINQPSLVNYPLMIKPADLDGSEGISKSSIVKNQTQADARIRFLRTKYKCDVMIEEFIEGREIYVGYLSGKNPKILHPSEVVFSKSTAPQREIASYKAKWDDSFRKKQGIKSRKSKLTKVQLKNISDLLREASRALGIHSYCRFDIRLRGDTPYLIEVNVNPGLEHQEDLSLSAKYSGLTYNEFIKSLVDEALYNFKNQPAKLKSAA